MQHYLEITALAENRSESALIVSQSIERLHGALYTQGAGRVGMALPNLETGSHRANPGNVLRLFGERDDLEFLIGSPGIRHLARAGALRINPLQETPPDHHWIRYVRDRSPEKTTDRALERNLSRFRAHCVERHGREPSAAELDARRRRLIHGAKAGATRAFISVRSRTNGQMLSLIVRPEETDGAGTGPFGSYGLAGPGGPAVPAFACSTPFL